VVRQGGQDAVDAGQPLPGRLLRKGRG
jgi:hypothetical protein